MLIFQHISIFLIGNFTYRLTFKLIHAIIMLGVWEMNWILFFLAGILGGGLATLGAAILFLSVRDAQQGYRIPHAFARGVLGGTLFFLGVSILRWLGDHIPPT